MHICFKCDKAPKFYCLCCPSAICGPCLYEAEFAVVKGDKGLCDECLELVLRKEEKKDVDPNQVCIVGTIVCIHAKFLLVFLIAYNSIRCYIDSIRCYIDSIKYLNHLDSLFGIIHLHVFAKMKCMLSLLYSLEKKKKIMMTRWRWF